MNAYETQMIAKYHQADLLSEARQARLARDARQASAAPRTERVTLAAFASPVRSALAAVAFLHRGARAASSAAAAQTSVSGHVMLSPAHPR